MRYLIYTFIALILIIACSSEDVIKSSDNEKINVIKTDKSESSTFDFEFASGKSFSSDDIKESGSPHFLYFFTPT